MSNTKTTTKVTKEQPKIVGHAMPNIPDDMDTKTMSSVGAELNPETAHVDKIDGKTTLDAGGPYVAAAPQPTPAEAVAYPATGGLPDTGPNSKYVLGENRGPKLFNEKGQRVDRDGEPVDENFDRIPKKGSEDAPQPDPKKAVSKATKAEMERGAKALAR